MNAFYALLIRTLVAAALLTGGAPAAYAADAAASGPAEASASQVEASPLAPASGNIATGAMAPGAVPHSAPASAPGTAAPEQAAASAPQHAAPAMAPKPPTAKKSAPKKAEPKHAAPARLHRRTRTHAPKHAAPATPARSPATARKRKAAAASGVNAAQKVAPDERQNRNPVLEAINLVATTQQAEIQAADKKVSESDWWTDTLERDWIVRRPFGPGIFDSTHWFYVSYKVNGRILMSWFVDLNKGAVSAIAPPEQSSQR